MKNKSRDKIWKDGNGGKRIKKKEWKKKKKFLWRYQRRTGWQFKQEMNLKGRKDERSLAKILF